MHQSNQVVLYRLLMVGRPPCRNTTKPKARNVLVKDLIVVHLGLQGLILTKLDVNSQNYSSL